MWWRATALVLALTSCSPGVDVVARAVDASDDGPVGDAGDASAKSPACRPSEPIVIATPSKLYAFDVDLPGQPEDLGAACIEEPIGAVAVDRQRGISVASHGKLVIFDRDTHQCRPTGVPVAPSAMAFVWDPKEGRENLYAIIAGTLVVFSSDLSSRTPIGTLPAVPVRGLAGTNDGHLVAFAGDNMQAFDVDLGDASMMPRWEFGDAPHRDGGPIAGGVVGVMQLFAVFGTRVYRYDASKLMGLVYDLGDLGAPIVGVSSAPCWPIRR